MALTALYFRYDNKDGFIKALVTKGSEDFFDSLMPSRSPEVFKGITKKDEFDQENSGSGTVNKNPDKGYGEPGSLEWFENNVLIYDSKPDIVAYVKEVTGVKISPAGSLADVKQRGIEQIKETKSNDGQGSGNSN